MRLFRGHQMKCNGNLRKMAKEVARQVKVFATKPVDLSLILGTPTAERENLFLKNHPLSFLQEPWHAHIAV